MKNVDILDSILSDQEKLAVQMFIDNETQREAVRKVLLCGLYYNGTLEKGKPANPLLNFALAPASQRHELKLTDEEIGRNLSAQWEGISLLELGFSNMFRYKKEIKEKVEEKNIAR